MRADFWKNWRGVPWERQSLGAKWGSELISGFGPFEFVDMCEEAGIEPIVTTTAQWGDHMGKSDPVTCCNASDMGDLVECVKQPVLLLYTSSSLSSD